MITRGRAWRAPPHRRRPRGEERTELVPLLGGRLGRRLRGRLRAHRRAFSARRLRNRELDVIPVEPAQDLRPAVPLAAELVGAVLGKTPAVRGERVLRDRRGPHLLGPAAPVVGDVLLGAALVPAARAGEPALRPDGAGVVEGEDRLVLPEDEPASRRLGGGGGERRRRACHDLLGRGVGHRLRCRAPSLGAHQVDGVGAGRQRKGLERLRLPASPVLPGDDPGDVLLEGERTHVHDDNLLREHRRLHRRLSVPRAHRVEAPGLGVVALGGVDGEVQVVRVGVAARVGAPGAVLDLRVGDPAPPDDVLGSIVVEQRLREGVEVGAAHRVVGDVERVQVLVVAPRVLPMVSGGGRDPVRGLRPARPARVELLEERHERGRGPQAVARGIGRCARSGRRSRGIRERDPQGDGVRPVLVALGRRMDVARRPFEVGDLGPRVEEPDASRGARLREGLAERLAVLRQGRRRNPQHGRRAVPAERVNELGRPSPRRRPAARVVGPEANDRHRRIGGIEGAPEVGAGEPVPDRRRLDPEALEREAVRQGDPGEGGAEPLRVGVADEEVPRTVRRQRAAWPCSLVLGAAEAADAAVVGRGRASGEDAPEGNGPGAGSGDASDGADALTSGRSDRSTSGRTYA